MDGNENLFEREAEDSYGPHTKKQNYSCMYDGISKPRIGWTFR